MLTMFDYMYNLFNYLPGVFSGTVLNPACKYLFTMNDNQTKVIPIEQEMFHHHVAKLLYLSKR